MGGGSSICLISAACGATTACAAALLCTTLQRANALPCSSARRKSGHVRLVLTGGCALCRAWSRSTLRAPAAA